MRKAVSSPTLPIALNGATNAYDISDAQGDVTVRFTGIANSAAYKIQGRVDDDESSWLDITKSFTDMVAGTALTGPIAADGMYRTHAFGGSIRILCSTGATGGTPTVVADISRQVIG